MDPIAWTGLEIDPASKELQRGLHAARLAVLDAIANDDDDSDDEDDQRDRRAYADRMRGGATAATLGSFLSAAFEEKRDAPTTTLSREDDGARALAFEGKVEKILAHLDLSKLSRLATLYVVAELLHLKRVTVGLALLLLGVFGQCVMHRHKFMVASIIFLCLYRSKVRLIVWRQVNTWAHRSTDKLGAFTWTPRVVCFVPIAMRVFGQMKFMVFLQRDLFLGMVVLVVTAALVLYSFQDGVSDQHKLWGQGKRLKFVAYGVTILYWGVWRGELADTLRLLPPALIDAGGIVLGSVTSAEVQTVFRNAWKKLYAEVAGDIQQDGEFDAWFMLGLSNWLIDYWQQPTTFSLEMLTQMLSECFSSLENTAVHVFRPELRHLKSQMASMSQSSEMAVLIAYLKKSLNEIPPSKRIGILGTYRAPSYHRCLNAPECAFVHAFDWLFTNVSSVTNRSLRQAMSFFRGLGAFVHLLRHVLAATGALPGLGIPRRALPLFVVLQWRNGHLGRSGDLAAGIPIAARVGKRQGVGVLPRRQCDADQSRDHRDADPDRGGASEVCDCHYLLDSSFTKC